jgi:tetratricopeptide (TPR) repeat protein
MRTMRALSRAGVLVLTAGAFAGEDTQSWRLWEKDRIAELEWQGLYDEAIEESLVLSVLAPEDSRPLAHAARLAVESPTLRGGELIAPSPLFDIAQRCVRDAIGRWGQGDPTLAYAIGRLAFAQKKWPTAYRMFLEAKERGFEPPIVRLWLYRAAVNRAPLLIESGRGGEVVGELERLRTTLPGHPDERSLLVNLAAAHHRIQESEAAIRILEELVRKAPDAAEAYYLWGIVLRDKGDFEGAEARFRDALRHASATFRQETYRDSLLRLSEVLVKLNRLDDAEAMARQHLEIAKDDPGGLFALARVAQARGDLPEAVRLFRRVARLQPDALDTLLALKQVLYQLNETKEADQVDARIQEILRRREADLQGR